MTLEVFGEIFANIQPSKEQMSTVSALYNVIKVKGRLLYNNRLRCVASTLPVVFVWKY